ncbi:MAG: type IV pilus secretin PilQ/predicted competence protein [Candidatus Omnitrophota bacterium]|jgi:type IV pilus secretin PilQ/predicted competence protein
MTKNTYINGFWSSLFGGKSTWRIARFYRVLIVTSLLVSASGDEAINGFRDLPFDVPMGTSDEVTLNLENTSLVSVLHAFSLQTGRSIVIGPEVDAVVNIRLRKIPWEEALDVMLRPYGYGYTLVGQTVVVNKQETIAAQQTTEPIETRVFHLKYLDASDIKEFISPLLSERGHLQVLTTRGQKGWEFESSTGRGSSGGSKGVGAAGKRERDLDEIPPEALKSKLFIVSDIPSVITAIEAILYEVDKMPMQVLIEAKFVEVNSDFLRDMGVEFGTGPNAVSNPEVQPWQVRRDAASSEIFGVGLKQSGGGVTPGAFDAQSLSLAPAAPFNSGMSFVFQRLTDAQFEVVLHMLQEDDSSNVLSSPSIVTLNNQEASIIVGTKFPIISSSTSGDSATVSTSLEYYENIGIQLNVVPQVCDGDYISMIVHPAVTDQIGVAAARTGTEGNVPLTEYPILSTREAETQIMLQNNHTLVIGGLLEEKEKGTVLKVPFLGDIPVLGRVFKRDTVSEAKLDLLIFLTARIVTPYDSVETAPNARYRPPVSTAIPTRLDPVRKPPVRLSELAMRRKATRTEAVPIVSEAPALAVSEPLVPQKVSYVLPAPIPVVNEPWPATRQISTLEERLALLDHEMQEREVDRDTTQVMPQSLALQSVAPAPSLPQRAFAPEAGK